ncbi:hypothetical protein CJF32_00003383 [Rutstroemia sp. NJR-2017a WRK4]|nr:hypothetical protein CJF32_00003383 [Rutstroemia sp. NJR-2017a WRK4]
MQFTKIIAVLSGLALVCARPSASIRSSLMARVEECSCDDAENAFNVCLLERCGHGCGDADTAPCVATVGMYIGISDSDMVH